jgi:hypothetical protein
VTPRVLLLLLVALVPLVVILELGRPVTPVRVTGTPPVTTTFADGFRQHLGTVQEAAAALVDLGERRERNLLVVSQRQSAMNAALDATDAWLSQQPAQQSEPAVVAYRAGAAGIRQAMADAQSAFLRFDWVGIAAANDMLKQGIADISAAEDLLHSANGT